MRYNARACVRVCVCMCKCICLVQFPKQCLFQLRNMVCFIVSLGLLILFVLLLIQTGWHKYFNANPQLFHTFVSVGTGWDH